MKTRLAWNHGHPALLMARLALAVFGAAILIGLAVMLYDERLSRDLVQLGIPTTLLTEAIGVTAVFTGGAIFAAAWTVRRRNRI